MSDATVQSRLQTGLTHHQAGRFTEAASEYQAVLRSDPHNPDALHLLGLIKHQAGDNARAIELITQAIERQPQSAEFCANLGRIYSLTGRMPEAVHWMARAYDLQPNSEQLRKRLVNYLAVLGTNLVNENRAVDALQPLEHAVQLQPNHAEAVANLGLALLRLKRYEQAVERFQHALALRPDLAAIHTNLGGALLALGRAKEAVAAHRRACELAPTWLASKCNLALALAQLSEDDEALGLHEEVLREQPDSPNSLFARGVLRLRRGDFKGGWPDYEARFRVPELKGQQSFPHPQWYGEQARDKTLLVYAEQGLGDVIQFVRYLPGVLARCGRVILQCQDALARWMQFNFPGVQVVRRGEPLPDFDLRVPIMSLPLAFGSTLETIPCKVPYLATPLRTQLPASDFPRVGVVWAGHPGHYNDCNRSIAINQFLPPLLQVPNAQIISLQKHRPVEEFLPFKDRAGDLSGTLNDLADAAGAIQALDLVITVDTSIAHLAGALGAKTWTLLAEPADFRWMIDRLDSPWYPTMRLFRQTRPGNWQSVMQNVAAELARFSDEVARTKPT